MPRWDHHLGELAAALVDGELDQATRERALGHLARCTDCRGEVERQRWLKARLRGLTDQAVTADFLGRLFELPVAAAFDPRLGTSSGHRVRPRPRPRRAPHPTHRRLGYAIAGSTSALLATVGVTAYAVGGGGSTVPQVTPVMQRLVDERMPARTGVPLTDAGLGVAVTVSARQRR